MSAKLITYSQGVFDVNDAYLKNKILKVYDNPNIPIETFKGDMAVDTKLDTDNIQLVIVNIIAILEIATEYINIKSWWSLLWNAPKTIGNINSIQEGIAKIRDSIEPAYEELKNIDMPEVLQIVEVLITGLKELLPKFKRVK